MKINTNLQVYLNHLINAGGIGAENKADVFIKLLTELNVDSQIISNVEEQITFLFKNRKDFSNQWSLAQKETPVFNPQQIYDREN